MIGKRFSVIDSENEIMHTDVEPLLSLTACRRPEAITWCKYFQEEGGFCIA